MMLSDARTILAKLASDPELSEKPSQPTIVMNTSLAETGDRYTAATISVVLLKQSNHVN